MIIFRLKLYKLSYPSNIFNSHKPIECIILALRTNKSEKDSITKGYQIQYQIYAAKYNLHIILGSSLVNPIFLIYHRHQIKITSTCVL
jgi:hypothetical protein